MADADEKKVKLDAIGEEDPVVLKYQWKISRLL